MEDHCPKCSALLTNMFERTLRETPEAERTHLLGGAYVVRESAGREVVGECRKHGIVRKPLYVLAGMV